MWQARTARWSWRSARRAARPWVSLDLGEQTFDTPEMRSEAATAEAVSRLQEVAARARPVALAREHVLPVLEPLQTLLPDGLRRGSTVAVGSTSLALALAAGPSAAGSWTAAAGVPALGLTAAAELGVSPGR